MTTVVIVGGGLAGAKTAEALREKDFDGNVVLFGAEERLPYERPPLSKEFLARKKKPDEFTVHDTNWYLDHRVDLRPGTAVERVDAEAKTVVLPDGSTVAYDTLVLATGSSSRHLDLPGADAAGVHHLRTLDDARALDEAIAGGGRLAIVGGGWIGLEVAATARERGMAVTVAEVESLPLLRALGPDVAQVFANLHRAHDVDLRTGVQVTEILTADGRAAGLKFADETTVYADAVLVAAGAIPDLDLAISAGVDIDGGGVLVDAGLRSSDPSIYVVGDIANATHPILGRRVRTEHWANALNQPAVAAANIVGEHAEYTNLPYFFTDQYDLGMEYSGLGGADDRVITRGDLAKREFVAFWVDDAGHVRAGMQVNIWDQLDDIKKLIESGSAVDVDRLADAQVPLASLF
ncbi:FAD-dependent oxidoreductase [Gordonia sp. NB41Y]|uniref:NAD(P)/FAD-dependent oxidoreductase n=1 Tax=Gordonia sp. NB41Y TaxID=875808 RepID=UPI0006B1DEC9|nr:FAD-dependent oxidoreductase [Gordonia sp. NB41Y]EMP11618.2 pyridine nucleotide-disulfide oxidoreductase [Gordonia sp. NB41Y]WLP88795.1 FAD-dependent oxidoreductase [Gordonia sp. NB41Y]